MAPSAEWLSKVARSFEVGDVLVEEDSEKNERSYEITEFGVRISESDNKPIQTITLKDATTGKDDTVRYVVDHDADLWEDFVLKEHKYIVTSSDTG